MRKKNFLIDLDGVLNEYGKEPYDENNIPNIREGAVDFIKELSKYGDLYLFTSRNLLLSSKWLITNNVDQYFADITNIKIPSYLHIDDRCVCFRGDYNQTLNDVKQFGVHWK